MRILLAVALIMNISLARAAGDEVFTPTFVGCFPGGTCFIGIAPPATKTTCVSTGQIRFDIGSPGSPAQYAAALTAWAMGKRIKVYETDNCIDNFPTPGYLHVVN